jgi:ferritin-like protein
MNNYHEPPKDLSNNTRSITRALLSFKEEIEAVDWYQQRIDQESNSSLKEILLHNMKEEMEHACMTLEWLRRNMDGWNEQLKKYMFSEDDITDIE